MFARIGLGHVCHQVRGPTLLAGQPLLAGEQVLAREPLLAGDGALLARQAVLAAQPTLALLAPLEETVEREVRRSGDRATQLPNGPAPTG